MNLRTFILKNVALLPPRIQWRTACPIGYVDA